jgi:glycosyltransferase involved in cell wall biosynthesis
MQEQGCSQAESRDRTEDAILKAKAERRLSITALICTLNEEESLPHVLPRIPDWVDEVLLVDGHSTDRTVEVARELRPKIRVVYQPGEGKGDALRYGIQQATGDIIVTLDADGQTNPENMADFVNPLLNGYDFSKGSRFLNLRPNITPTRRFGNWLFTVLTNMLFGTRYTDLCAGYNAFWKRIYEKLDPDGTSFLDEPTINIKIKKAGLRVVEVPQPDVGRITGKGKNHNLRQGWRILRNILRERFRG